MLRQTRRELEHLAISRPVLFWLVVTAIGATASLPLMALANWLSRM
jgi:hypothetical protein